MKKINITHSVMDNVVTLEKKRVVSWKRKFFLILGGLLVFLGGLIFITGKLVFEQKTYELLSLFSEDREIIMEFWQDTIMNFIETLPHPEIELGFVCIALIIIAIISTRRTRKVMKTKEKELRAYKRSQRRGA
jgi:hypothetical protein